MPRFQRKDTADLAMYLHNSSIHDSIFESNLLDDSLRSIRIVTFNPISKIRTTLEFSNVVLLIALNECKWGLDSSLNTLAILEDYSYAEAFLTPQGEFQHEFFHFVFELFTGGQLHIFASELFVEETPTPRAGDRVVY